MTAINIAVTKRQALVIADSLVSGGASSALTSKLIVLSHLQTVVGVAGHLDMLISVIVPMLCGTPPGSGLADLVETWPEELRAIAARRGYTKSTTVFAIGVTDDNEVAAYHFTADAFEPRRIPPGAWILPGLDEPPDARDGDAASGGPPDGRPEAPTIKPPPANSFEAWSRYRRIAVDAMIEQQRRFPDSIGGPRVCVHLTPDGVNVSWLDALPPAEAAPA